jgi:hypothetical protein
VAVMDGDLKQVSDHTKERLATIAGNLKGHYQSVCYYASQHVPGYVFVVKVDETRSKAGYLSHKKFLELDDQQCVELVKNQLVEVRKRGRAYEP